MYRIYCIVFFLFFSKSFAQNNSSFIPFQSPDKQYGYKDESGQIIIRPEFEQALHFTGNYAYVKKNKGWGIITSKGKWLVPAIYEDLGWTCNKHINSGEEITGYKQGGKWGLLSLKNKALTLPLYDVLQYISDNKIKAGRLSSQPQPDTLFGLLNAKGKELLPLQYHSLETSLEPGTFLAGTNKIYYANGTAQAYGLISSDNRIILPIQYKSIIQREINTFEVTPFYTWKVVTLSGDTLASVTADSLYAVSEDIYGFVFNNRAGVVSAKSAVLKADLQAILPRHHGFAKFKSVDKYGVFVFNNPASVENFLPAAYDSIYIENAQLLRAGRKQQDDWIWELMTTDTTGETKNMGVSYNFIDTTLKAGNLTRVKNKNLYGFINHLGEEVIPVQYDSVGNFIDSLCVAVYHGKYGVLKKDGSWLFEPNADDYQMNQNGFFIKREKGVWSVHDVYGKRKYTGSIPLSFMPDGSISMIQNGKYGRLSTTGVVSVPPIYDSISDLTYENGFWAFQGKNIYLYKSNGEMLIKQGNVIEKLNYIPNDYSPVITSGRYGFVDGLGRLRISNRYEGAYPFSEDLAAIKLTGKWAFINKHEKIIVQPYYDEVSSFKDGLAIAKKRKKYGLINKSGKETTDFMYDKIIRHPTGMFISVIGKKQGIIGKNGQEAIYVKYDKVFPQPDGNIIVNVGNKYGVVNAKGITIFPIAYDFISINPFSSTYLLCMTPKIYEVNTRQFASPARTKRE